jgi:solute carrier family 8 (sodium/calcium exchanger)
MAIAIISDIFMSAIEKITSAKKRIVNQTTGRTVTVTVWNATVANLTLMALGSSAPEILLSCIEISSNRMHIGELGSGTIVGSAAFNLLIISAVCVCAIPDNEVRKIKEIPVYIVTASCSVFAYVWLLFILMIWSPNVVNIEEALLTFLFFPLLIAVAFAADKGYFSKKEVQQSHWNHVISADVTKEELAQLEQEIRDEHGTHLTEDQVIRIMEVQYFGKTSRAVYRHAAMTRGMGGKSIHTRKISSSVALGDSETPFSVVPVANTADDVEKEADARMIEVGFAASRYAFLEDAKLARLTLVRSGPLHCAASVGFKTRAGTATATSDYEHMEGTIDFAVGEQEKLLNVPIIDDTAHEDDEEFYVDLFDPKCDGQPIRLSEISMVTVVIIDDDEPGNLRFKNEVIEVEEAAEDKIVDVIVERYGGASGVIGCKYHTENNTAVAGFDFVEIKGKLELEPTLQNFAIPVTVKAKGRCHKTDTFWLHLSDPAGGAKFDPDSDGGKDGCICTITIVPNKRRTDTVHKLKSVLTSSNLSLGHKNWRSQFVNALFINSGDDDAIDEDQEAPAEDDQADQEQAPGLGDWCMHIMALPWKLLFALVPPVDYCGGWACFCCSLGVIALVTAVVADLANLVGCCLDIDPEITAITIVALGTSLPDTFASKTAATIDPYADASIGNITGSNSVNVFLGLGMPWTLAAIYWKINGATDDWHDQFMDGGLYCSVRDSIAKLNLREDEAVFVVPQGSIGWNLLIFSVNAFFAIQHLGARRKTLGGELGGPKRAQYLSAFFLLFQWTIYIGLSIYVCSAYPKCSLR